jgi:hypothetical protein
MTPAVTPQPAQLTATWAGQITPYFANAPSFGGSLTR